MKKAFFFLILALMTEICFLSPQQVFAQEKKDISGLKFDETLWSQVVLDVYARGTKIVDTETDFDVPPPPENESEQTQKELDELISISKTKRTQSVVEKILFENKPILIMEIFFGGGYFDKVNNTKTYQMIEMADYEMQYFTAKYKKKYLRARPNVLRPELETVIPNPEHPAYPSGHSGQSWLAGLILSYVDPAHKDEYMNFAKSVGYRREIAGVHYPSDSEAGRKLAEQVYAKLMENKVFVKKMDAAKLSYIAPDFSKAYVVTEFDELTQK